MKGALWFACKFGKAILLTGDRSELAPELVGVAIRIGAPDIRVQEDMHLAVCHILAGEVKLRIAEVAQAVSA